MRPIVVGACILLAVFFSRNEAHAEGGCPPGMMPFQFAPNQPPSCAPVAGGRQKAPEVWSDRSGAIAADLSLGILGTATDMKSDRAAGAAALDDCKAKGGTDCKVEFSFKNECAAFTVSDGRPIHFTAAATPERAIEMGMEDCTAEGAKNCRTYYSACSFPVRIQ